MTSSTVCGGLVRGRQCTVTVSKAPATLRGGGYSPVLQLCAQGLRGARAWPRVRGGSEGLGLGQGRKACWQRSQVPNLGLSGSHSNTSLKTQCSLMF